MRRITLRIPLPSTEGLLSAARLVATAMAGAAAGHLATLELDRMGSLPIFAGLGVGLLLGSPWRPRDIEEALSRGLLVLGGAVTAGYLAQSTDRAAAWIVLAAVVAMAIGAPAATLVVQFGRGALSAASALAGLGTLWLLSEERLVDMDSGSITATLVGAGTLGLWAAISTGLGVRAKGAEEDERRTPRPILVASPGEFDGALDELRETARRVESLLPALASARPDDNDLVTRVTDTLRDTIAQAEQAVARWHTTTAESRESRAATLRQRIGANEAIRDREADPAIRRELDATLERQRRALAASDSIEAARRAFGCRLQQAQAGLELLEVAVEQAVTAGRGIDNGEVDAVAEALHEAHTMLDLDLDRTPPVREHSVESESETGLPAHAAGSVSSHQAPPEEDEASSLPAAPNAHSPERSAPVYSLPATT